MKKRLFIMDIDGTLALGKQLIDGAAELIEEIHRQHGICCYFTVSLGVWSEIRTEMLPVVAAGYVISRALSGIAVVTFPAARGSGLVKTFQDGAQKKAVRITMIVYLILAAVYLYFCSPVGMVVLLIIAGVVFGYYYRMSRKQFGGVTGDLAGYFLQICELALLVGGLIVQGIK